MPVIRSRAMLNLHRAQDRLAGHFRPPPRRGGGMSLAASSSSYPLLDIFWTIFEIFSVGDLDLDPDHGVHRHLPQS
jgi:hypothetical protein